MQQLLIAYATEAANGFPAGQQRDLYTAAASSLRLPYWDWAKSPAGGHVLPDFMVQPRINVVTPQGSNSIDNPLYSYKFHPIDPGLQFPPVRIIILE
jgi:tyrosinase